MISTVVQAFNSRVGNFLLDPICIESKFLAICDISENEGPMKSYRSNRLRANLVWFLRAAYQAFNASGNLVSTRFVLNPDFTVDIAAMGANLDGVAGNEVIAGGREVAGLAPGAGVSGVRIGRIIQIHPVCFEPGF